MRWCLASLGWGLAGNVSSNFFEGCAKKVWREPKKYCKKWPFEPVKATLIFDKVSYEPQIARQHSSKSNGESSQLGRKKFWPMTLRLSVGRRAGPCKKLPSPGFVTIWLLYLTVWAYVGCRKFRRCWPHSLLNLKHSFRSLYYKPNYLVIVNSWLSTRPDNGSVSHGSKGQQIWVGHVGHVTRWPILHCIHPVPHVIFWFMENYQRHSKLLFWLSGSSLSVSL